MTEAGLKFKQKRKLVAGPGANTRPGGTPDILPVN
jgi:hypothetical protein